MSEAEAAEAKRGRNKLSGKEKDDAVMFTASIYKDNYWDKICQAYIDDKPVQDINTEYGVSKVSIYRHLRLRNIPKRTAKGPGMGLGRKKQTDKEMS